MNKEKNCLDRFVEHIHQTLFQKSFRFTFSSCLCAAVLFVLFLFPGTTPWINDEPIIISSALQANDTGTIVKQGLLSAYGLHFPPLAFWFYQFLLLLTYNPILLASLKTLISVLAICWAVRRIAKSFELDWKIVFSLLLASPYLWHYTRSLWDNVFLFPVGLCLFAFFLVYAEKHSVANLLGAAVCGMCMLLIHPMSFPVVAPLPLIVLLYAWNENSLSKKQVFVHTFLAGLIAGVPPLLYYLSAYSKNTSAPSPTLNGIFFRFIGLVQQLSGFDFTEDLIPDLILRNTWQHYVYSRVSFTIAILFWILCAAGIFLTVKKIISGARDGRTWLCFYALIVSAVKITFDSVIGLKLYPHYQTPGVLAAFILLLAGTTILKQYRIKFLQTVTVFLLFLTCSVFYTIHVQEGSRSFLYGALLSNQYNIVKQIHQEIRSGHVAVLTNKVNNYKLFPHSFYALIQLCEHEYKILPKPADGKRYEYELRHVGSDPRFGGIELVRTKEIIQEKNKQ